MDSIKILLEEEKYHDAKKMMKIFNLGYKDISGILEPLYDSMEEENKNQVLDILK